MKKYIGYGIMATIFAPLALPLAFGFWPYPLGMWAATKLFDDKSGNAEYVCGFVAVLLWWALFISVVS